MNKEERIQLRNYLLEEFKKLKIITLLSNNNYRVTTRNTFLKKISLNEKLQETYNLYINEFNNEEEAIYCLTHNDDKENHRCIICNNYCQFYKSKRFNKYRDTCGNKECIKKSIINEETINKRAKTNIKKYGAQSPLSNNIIREKGIKTLQEKYSVNNPMQNNNIKKKALNTYYERYGIKKPIKNSEIENIINEIIGRNIINNNNYFLIYNNDFYFKEFIEKLYTIKNRLLRLSELSEIFNLKPQTIKNKLTNLNLLKYFYIHDSNLEILFKNFLDENNIQYERHDRRLYIKETNGRQEIDFLLSNCNIGIEINDLNTHNIINKDINYHINKSILANEKGIRLIHIWEWELVNEVLWNRLSKWILNICNNNKVRIFARKTIIKEIPQNIEREFLNNYHLQGYIKSKKCYGLYYNNELIQIMSFSIPRYNKNYQWELLRLCTKYGYNVIGGAQKLLKNFIKDNKDFISIISYCDMDKFNGRVYEELGFKLLKKNKPSAIWYNKETNNYFRDSSLIKIGADKLLKTNYGKNTNNEEIAYKSGYQKVYNCGINVYVYCL